MKSRKKAAALSAIVVACAPVVARATNFFTDNFDAGTSSTRYDQYGADRTGQNDFRAVYNFDYGSFKYWHIAADQSTQNVGEFIPQAPRSAGAAKIGLLLDANNSAAAPAPDAAQIDVIPKLAEYAGGLPTGDYQMLVDVFADYNGRFQGGGGSTEFFKAGINQLGGGLGGLLNTGSTTTNTKGQAIAISGDGQNGLDYRHYQGNSRLAELDDGAGFVAQDQGTNAPGPSGSENPYYLNTFTFTDPNNAANAWYETPGAVGKHWTTVKLKYEDGIVYTYLKPAGSSFTPNLDPNAGRVVDSDGYVLVAARTDTTSTSGHILLGYADTINGVAQLEDGDGSLGTGGFGDANFAIFDNVSVDSINQTRQKWAVAGTANWSNPNAWQNQDIADGITEVADFTTLLPNSQIVFLDSARTVRSVTFDSQNASTGYTISGANTLTLDTLTSGIRTQIKAVTGQHEISAPVVSNKPLTFNVAAGASVKVDNLSFNIVEGPARTPIAKVLEKTGAGTAEINRIMLTATTANVTVSGGVLKITQNGTASGVSVVSNMTFSGGGRLDLSNNNLITRLAVGVATANTYSGATGLIQSGRNGGAWNGQGIVTSQSTATTGSLTTIGVASAQQVKGLATASDTAVWSGQTVTGSQTLVMYTYGGDANLDGKINVDDYGRIDSSIPLGINGWYNGDFNFDGKINVDDYGIIDSNIGIQGAQFPTGGESGPSGISAVPEPGSLALLAVGGLLLRMRRSRRG